MRENNNVSTPGLALFNRDFTLVVIGQIISLFGNTALRFALPLYILDMTGSAAAFGTILAISMIPAIVLSPFGGMIADRINRRDIMACLDFATAVLAALFGAAVYAAGGRHAEALIALMLILLSVIQSFYQPAVQSSIPALASQNHLMKANAVVSQVNSLSALLGPVIGGVLYGFWGLLPVVAVSAVSFFLSAVMEIFIHMPSVRQTAGDSILSTVKNDFCESMRFIGREKPVILSALLIVTVFNLFMTSMLMVGMPFIVKVLLQFSSQAYGVVQSALGGGAILGGLLIMLLGNRLKISNLHLILFALCAASLPLAAAALPGVNPLAAYLITMASCLVFMALASMFSVVCLTFIQQETAPELIGKVMAYVLTFSMCSQPVGQAVYGFLFDLAAGRAYLVVCAAAAAGLVTALVSRRIFSRTLIGGKD